MWSQSLLLGDLPFSVPGIGQVTASMEILITMYMKHG